MVPHSGVLPGWLPELRFSHVEGPRPVSHSDKSRIRDDQLTLARQGTFLERCFTTPVTGKCEWARMVDNIGAAGPERTIVTTDLGQPHNPQRRTGLP